MKFSKVKLAKNNKHVHKVHIIGDSHFKGIAAKIKQYLGSNYVVSSFIKPGANVKQIVEAQEIEFECLGGNDFIVINGGSNDLANNSSEDNSVLSCLLNFVNKYPNTNVLILNVPIRYDSLTNYRINQEIMNFNDTLQKNTRQCNHVQLIEISTDRKYFTNHGFHLNKPGKERIVKQIVSQIRETVNSVSKNEHTYPPHLKEDYTSVTMKIDVTQPSSFTSSEGNAPQLGTKLPQEHCTQQERSIMDHKIRMSNDYNKAEMSAVAEMVIENRGLEKVEEGKSEFVSGSELEHGTPYAKKTGDEAAQVVVNIDEIRGLCIVDSETKNANESKCVRVSMSTFDLQSASVTDEDPSVIREMGIEGRVFDKVQEEKSEFESGSELQSVTVTEKDPCVIGENELQGTDIIMANKDISITEPSVSDTSMLSFRRSSSRNKIPPSRNSDFLW